MEKVKKAKNAITLGAVLENLEKTEPVKTVETEPTQQTPTPTQQTVGDGGEKLPKDFTKLKGRPLTEAILKRRENLALASAQGYQNTNDGFSRWDIVNSVVAWDKNTPILAIAIRQKDGQGKFQTIGHVRWAFDYHTGKLSPYTGDVCPITEKRQRDAANSARRAEYAAHIEAELARNPVAEALKGLDVSNFAPAPKNAK